MLSVNDGVKVHPNSTDTEYDSERTQITHSIEDEVAGVELATGDEELVGLVE